MSEWIVARTAHGRLSAVPAANDGSQSDPTAAKKRRRLAPYGRSLRERFRLDSAQPAGEVVTAPPPPFKQVTSSLQGKVTVVAPRGGIPLADRVPLQLFLPGQAPPVGGLSYVSCSKGDNDEMRTYVRPAPREPVVLLSCDNPDGEGPMRGRVGRTDYYETIALELVQPGRIVNPQVVVSYHGLMHFQQPRAARIMPTDSLVTQIAGTVRAPPTATVTLTHAYCLRDVVFTVGLAQGPNQTWLRPLRDGNERQHHKIYEIKDADDVDQCSGCAVGQWNEQRCINCGRGQLGHFRLVDGDTVQIENEEPEELGVGTGHFIRGFTFEVVRRTRSNRHAEDISPFDQ